MSSEFDNFIKLYTRTFGVKIKEMNTFTLMIFGNVFLYAIILIL